MTERRGTRGTAHPAPEEITPARDLGLTTSAWLISDTHFGHRNIAGYCGRPSYAEERMFDAWHRLVSPRDPIVQLGDLALGHPEAIRLRLAALPGDKFLVRGNRDTGSVASYRDLGFAVIRPFFLDFAGWTASFTHVPRPDLAGLPRHLNVHGHIHERLLPSLAHVNCAVEWTGYAPVRIEDLLARRIARIASAGSMERVVPLPYAEWLAREYGGEILRSDVERFPEAHERDRVRETYTAYRLVEAADQS